MSLHDLVEGDCGGTNALVKLSTHLVQDHAFKDQDLKFQSTQNENDEQMFMQTRTGEVNRIVWNNILDTIILLVSFLAGGSIF